MKEKLTKRICELLEGTEHEEKTDLDVEGGFLTTDDILIALKIYFENDLRVIDAGQLIYVTSVGRLYAPGISIRFQLNKGLNQSAPCISLLCEMFNI